MTILWLENCLEMVLYSKKHLSWFAVNEEFVEYILMGSAWLNLPGRGGGTTNYMSCTMGWKWIHRTNALAHKASKSDESSIYFNFFFFKSQLCRTESAIQFFLFFTWLLKHTKLNKGSGNLFGNSEKQLHSCKKDIDSDIVNMWFSLEVLISDSLRLLICLKQVSTIAWLIQTWLHSVKLLFFK